MSTYEMMQWAGIAAGVAVAGLAVYGLVRFSRQLDAMWPETAKRYGLTFTRTAAGSAMTNSSEAQTLAGPTLTVVSTREHVGNTRRTGTVVTAKTNRALPSLMMEVSRTRPKATVHLVSTGDAPFDALRFVTCESGALAASLLTPAVRQALLRCPQWTLRVTTTPGSAVVSFGATPTDLKELTGTIDAALALAKGDQP